MTRLIALPLAGLLLLPACVDTSSNAPYADRLPAPAIRTGGQVDEAACLDAVARETGNSVTLLSSEFSEANTLVMVGVGPNRAPWKCLSAKGVVAEIMSMTDEGAL